MLVILVFGGVVLVIMLAGFVSMTCVRMIVAFMRVAVPFVARVVVWFDIYSAAGLDFNFLGCSRATGQPAAQVKAFERRTDRGIAISLPESFGKGTNCSL